MNVVNLSIKIEPDNFYQSYLHIMNGILKLSKTEQIVLAAFMEIKNSNIGTSNETFTPKTRIQVREKLKVSEFNLNNYIKMLKDRKLIIFNNNNMLDISPKIFKPKDSTLINFNIEFNNDL